MLRIAIIDDVMAVCGQIENDLMDIAQSMNMLIEVEPYTNGESFCSALKNGESFDLIFLDIELKSMSGLEVCAFIRDTIGDEFQQVVFISSQKQYSLELHTFHPLDFLVKDITSDMLKKVIVRYLKISGNWNDTFEVKIGQDIEKIKIKDIKYLTIDSRIVRIVLDNDNYYEYYSTLKNAYNDLKKYGFLFVHKQFIVNPAYIKVYEYEQIVLYDGMKIPIGSSKRKEIRNKQLRSYRKDFER